jgi:6-phosphogluconolactonase
MMAGMSMAVNAYDNREALVRQVSDSMRSTIAETLAKREPATLVLAGGGTPMPIYASLAAADLDWQRVVAIPSDERWVAGSDEASNHLQMSRQFEQAAVRLERLVPEQPGPEPDASHARQILSSLPRPFDLVLLGMGGDGHFASLFPKTPELAAGLDPRGDDDALVVTPDPLPPQAPYARITLTLSALLDSHRLMLVITGDDKREVLERAGRPDADPDELPIAALIRAAGERLEIHWSP